MKRTLLILILAIVLTPIRVSAARAFPHPKTIQQPDGTFITLVGHGDEFQHYVTTTDGYTVVRGNDGFYRYAVSRNGNLTASEIKASDADCRPASVQNFLSSVPRHLKPQISGTGRKLRKLAERTDAPLRLFKSDNTSPMRSRSEQELQQRHYRGLVILVNFTDRKFSRGDHSRQLVDDKMNKPDWKSYDDPLLNGRFRCTGSVYDYFKDNSNGQFITEFDVVGPVEVDVDQYYINGTELTYELCQTVLQTADPDIDYSLYDSDGDGEVDMVYILYAGYASVYQGNDERLVWPHAGYFGDSDIEVTLDGKRIGRFACSSEIYGWTDYDDLYLDGIGVIVHEFSHVLGFKDHYDVSGYLNEDPGSWDVMASGNYNGVFNDTPCGYNSYEKYAAGFISPRTATADDDGETIELRPLSSSDDALRIVSMQDSTMFLFENRQLKKWDQHLPGHGMLVWRVDSCDREYWDHNALNVNGRLHFKLIRANGATMSLFQEIEDTDYDPFPGTRNITELTNYSIESDLLSNLNYPSPLMLRNIEETDGLVTFVLEEDSEARAKPYTFALNDRYSARGVDTDTETECDWTMSYETQEQNGRVIHRIYNLVPDTKGISTQIGGRPLGAAISVSGDKKHVYIEPARVALLDDYGIWLVDFNDLDNGGSGAIVLNMNPYGELSLANPESAIGYCSLPTKSPVVTQDKIIERISSFRNIRFDALAGIGNITVPGGHAQADNQIYNLQGIRVTKPAKGQVYIMNGKKVML